MPNIYLCSHNLQQFQHCSENLFNPHLILNHEPVHLETKLHTLSGIELIVPLQRTEQSKIETLQGKQSKPLALYEASGAQIIGAQIIGAQRVGQSDLSSSVACRTHRLLN